MRLNGFVICPAPHSANSKADDLAKLGTSMVMDGGTRRDS